MFSSEERLEVTIQAHEQDGKVGKDFLEESLWMSGSGDCHNVAGADQRCDPFEEPSVQYLGLIAPNQVALIHRPENGFIEHDPWKVALALECVEKR